MSVPKQQQRKDPGLKAEIAARLNKLVEETGLDKSVIAFRAGWTRTRMTNYTSGIRSPGIEELIELDKVLEPILGPYSSFYLVYEKHLPEMIEDFNMPALSHADVNKALLALLSDYIEMNRIKLEPKLTPQKMLDDFNEIYLPREFEKKNGGQKDN